MNPWPKSMPALAERVSLVPANRTVDEVVARLSTIEQDLDGFFAPAAGGPIARRDRHPLPDGVACFNGMYLQVTEAVRAELDGFESREFVERLDVLFAEFYFQAFDAAAADEWVSKAWAPLFARKDARGVIALQFAVAGMNAHINNDLAHALVLTWHELGLDPGHDTPEYRDYEKVNGILERVEAELKGPLSDRLIRDVDTMLGTADDFLALWSIRKAREEAWRRALVMRALPHLHPELDSLFDGFVGFAGNLLLRRSVLLG
jgi:Family of unknown function (DUF5995)